MKNKLYIILPIVAFAVIFINAFFGHLIFDLGLEQTINKYSVYIHLQPQWDSHPRNIIYYVTSVWDNPQTNTNDPYYEPELDIQLKTKYNPNELLYIKDKAYVELKHEFSDCKNEWKPILYRRVVDSITSQFSYLFGNQLNSDPYIIKYPFVANEKYTKNDYNSGYSFFVPICTVNDVTSYEYSVKVDDKDLAMEVYVVPTIQELENYQNNSDFTYYQGEQCSGINIRTFSGKCENISKESGLLIAIPDKLNFSVTKITINLHEIK